jgi:hypothetical protein
MHFSAVLSHLSHKGYQQLEAGCLGLKLQTDRPLDPTLLKPFNQNKVITDSDIHSIFFHNFFQYKSWLWLAALWKTMDFVWVIYGHMF